MNQSWIRLPTAILKDTSISKESAIVYAIMTDRAGEDNNLRISYKELSRLSGIPYRTIRRKVLELEKADYIKQHEMKDGGKPAYNVKQLLPPKKRGKKATKETETSYDLTDYKLLVNKFD